MNIGDDLMPSDKKPLFELVLTQIYVAIYVASLIQIGINAFLSWNRYFRLTH